MKWGNPEILIWLLLVIPLGWLLFTLLRRRRAALSQLVDPSMLPVLAPRWNPKRAKGRLLLRLLALVMMGLALARPQWGFHWEEVSRKGLDLMVVLDTSRSMMASDIKPSRLQQAKWGILDLLRNLQGDRVGLIPFAGSSVLQCPLTIDYAAFAMTLDDVYSGMIPRGGTDMEQALQTAIDSFPEESSADQVILLITDGEDHEGDALALLSELEEKDIRVYTIGIGTLEGEMVPGGDVNGAYFKDRQGQIVKTTLHEGTLQKLALGTGGTYARSAPGDTGLERVFNESIINLKRSEQESRTARIFEERFIWPIAMALFLLAWEALLSDRRKVLPEEVPS